MPATYKFNNLIVHADGPDKDDWFTFQLDILGDEPETQFYRRDHNGWCFLSDGVWYPTSRVPMQVREARVKYGAGDPFGKRK